MRVMLKLVDKGVKTTVITVPYMFKKREEIITMMEREMEDVKNIQMELLAMKNSISEITLYFQYLEIHWVGFIID